MGKNLFMLFLLVLLVVAIGCTSNQDTVEYIDIKENISEIKQQEHEIKNNKTIADSSYPQISNDSNSQNIKDQFKALQHELNVLTDNHPPIGPDHYLRLEERLDFFEKQKGVISEQEISDLKQKLQSIIPREFREEQHNDSPQTEIIAQQPSKSFELILPIRKEDVVFEHGGIWPFGVRGGEHPQGHPGIDFEAKEGTPIMAAGDGIVGFVGDSGHHGYKTITIFHENNFETYYTGAMKGMNIQKEDRVSAGQIIAYYAQPENGWPSIHFGLQSKIPDEAVCPVEHFSSKAKQKIEELFQKAFYKEQKEAPLLCNPCPEGGCR